jgi:hypothetical protein
MTFRNSLVIMALALSTACGHAVKGPVLALDSTDIDLDTVSYNAPRVVKYDLRVRNEGDVNLVLKDFRVDCDCTKAEADTCVIAPGETSLIHVSIQFFIPQSEPFAKRLTIITNDTVNSPVDVIFRGQAKFIKPVYSTPSQRRRYSQN